jgi:hypothetical protein
MDVKNDTHVDVQNIYVLTDDDVDNILLATDALYWTILQVFRGRDRSINTASARSKKDPNV